MGSAAGLGDDGAAVGMPDQNHRPVLESDSPLDGCDIIGERRQRILDRDDVEAGLLQDWDDLGPTRSIRPRAVDEDHVSHRGLRRVGRGGQCSENERRQETTGDRHVCLQSGIRQSTPLVFHSPCQLGREATSALAEDWLANCFSPAFEGRPSMTFKLKEYES